MQINLATHPIFKTLDNYAREQLYTVSFTQGEILMHEGSTQQLDLFTF